jgi:hypothetical protein
MKKLLLIIMLCCLGTVKVMGQKHKVDPFLTQVNKLKKLVIESSYYTPEVTDSLDINNKINQQLVVLLQNPKSVTYDLDKLFGQECFYIAHSKDKRLWFFSWYENTGGSFKSNRTVLQYRTAANKPFVIEDSQDGINNNEVYSSNGGSYKEIIKLPSEKDNVYLCFSDVVGCNTCCANIAQVIGLDKNIINFGIPAFKENSNNGESTFMIDSRCGNITSFAYDSKTRILSYEYIPDDNTPEQRDENDPETWKPINGSFYWNGTVFINLNKKQGE